MFFSARTALRALLKPAALALVCALSLIACAHAMPRKSGRIVKIVPEKRLVVLQQPGGNTVRVVITKDAHIERMGQVTKMGSFRVGDYAVVEIGGMLNEDPLEGVGLYDVYTAGEAPPPTGSVDKSIQGGFAVAGGSAATVPFTHESATVPLLGGGQHAAHSETTLEWNPTTAWNGVTGTPGEARPQPRVASPIVQPMMAPGTSYQAPSAPASTVRVAPAFPATPQGGTMTAAPAPAGSPWLAQDLPRSSGPPSPVVSAPVNTVRQMPTPTQNPMPNPSQLYDDGTPLNTAGAARPGMEIVSIQGSVTQIAAAQRMLTVQTMGGGQSQMVTVRIPLQVAIMGSRMQQNVGFEGLGVGDYVMLTGIQMMPGAVEARRVFVNK